jgi:hypothetical protein
LVIHPDGHVELQAPVQPLESPDTANFHKHDEVQSVHRIDHDFKARVEELCAVGVKPKQIMQQLLQEVCGVHWTTKSSSRFSASASSSSRPARLLVARTPTPTCYNGSSKSRYDTHTSCTLRCRLAYGLRP